MAKKPAKKFNFTLEIYERTLKLAEVTRNGEVRIQKSELKKAIEETLLDAAKRAAGGERIRLPVIGAIVRKDVKPRKAGKGKNPFTGEEMILKARPADDQLPAVQRDIILDSIEQAVNDAAVIFSETHKDIQEKFVSTLTHDLKTPLTAAKTNAELILRNSDKLRTLSSRQKELLEA